MAFLASALGFGSLLAAARLVKPMPAEGLVVHNYYYAKQGLADSVYHVRLTASVIRGRLGLVRGRVLHRIGGADSLPDVIWEAEYPDSVARQRDVEALEGNAEFEAIQRTMSGLIRRFERATWRVAAEPR